MADGRVAYRHIRDLAPGAHIAAINALIFRRNQDRVPKLREPSPRVFENVRIEQHALPIFELEMILYDKRRRGEAGLALHPEHGLEQMIEADFHVGGCCGCDATAE